MTDWDTDSPRLAANLKTVLRTALDQARRRAPIRVEDAKAWHRTMMNGLHVPNPNFVGRFRGEGGLEQIGVQVGDAMGTPPDQVADEPRAFGPT